MKLNLPPKLVKILVWALIILFVNFSFQVTYLMPYYAKTGNWLLRDNSNILTLFLSLCSQLMCLFILGQGSVLVSYNMSF
jgi:hypothetical protein